VTAAVLTQSPIATLRRASAWIVGLSIALYALLLANPLAAQAIEINENFKPQDEFRLDPWIEINVGPFDFSLNKAVLLLWLAGAATVISLSLIAKKMSADPFKKPSRIQFAVEAGYDLIDKQIVSANIKNKDIARKWFGFIFTIFFFVWFSNMLGYIPLPVNTHSTVDIFGATVPTFQLYAATANISVPLALTLIIWFAYHYEGIREHGPIGYVKTWKPSGTSTGVGIAVFLIEALSHFLRLVSLSVRLFANMLAGHMLILIMAGGMVVLLGSVFVSFSLIIGIAFYLFEVGLIASLQAFIFAILSAIYMGSAVSHDH
jgi:F-type H+-transporting ATPase subunit a